MKVLLRDANVSVHDKRVFLPRRWRRGVLDHAGQIGDESVQFVARLAVYLRVADAVDRFVNDRAQVESV